MTENKMEYGNWRRIDPVYDFQKAVVRNDETGDVLAIEKRPGYAPWDHGKEWQTVLLPEDYHNDEHYGEVTEYLAKSVSEEEAREVAVIYIEENDG